MTRPHRVFQSLLMSASYSELLKFSLVAALFISVLFHASHLLTQQADLDRMKQLNSERLEKSQLTSANSSKGPSPELIPYRSSSASTAAAQLLSDVSGLLLDSSALLISSQFLADNENNDEIDLSINAETSQASLQAILYKLETHNPTVFIKDLNIRIREEATIRSDVVLTLTIVITALWRAD